jgi:NitT/TauT family transport system substrate-binding protein
MFRTLLARLVLSALAATVSIGFGLSASKAADRSTPADQADARKVPVTIRFSWKLKGEYAPLYVALEKGYFSDEGLAVQLGEGAGSQAALASMLRGDDQAVWLPGIFALQAISKGMAMKLVALYNPAAPVIIISWPEKPIRTPKDLEGKSIAASVGETGTTYLPVLCAKNNIDCSKIKQVRMGIEARVPAFIAHSVDSVSVYLTNDMPILEAKFGKDAFVRLDEPKWGAGVPGSALLASDSYISQHPDVLAKLVRAINRGMGFSAKDPMAAAEILLRYWSAQLSPNIVADQVRALTDAVPTYDGQAMGHIEKSVIEAGLVALREAGEADSVRAVDVYFTNSVVDLANRGSRVSD